MITKKILFLQTLLLLSLTAVAQDFGLGIKGGGIVNSFNRSNITGKSTFGYNFGGFVSYNVIKNLGIQVEALYVRTTLRNESFPKLTSLGDDHGKIKFNYLSLPVLLKVDVLKFLSVLVGPQFNYLRNADKYKLNDGSSLFESKLGTYTAGVDLGPFYFRYIWGQSSFKNRSLDRDFQNV